MADQDEIFMITTVEQLRAIADPLRQRVLEPLLNAPLTATQVAERLNEPPAKIYYHVRELEKVGLIRLVETREKGGILEKYYQAVARNIGVDPSVLRTVPLDDTIKALQSIISVISADALEAIRTLNPESPGKLRISREMVYMTDAEYTAFNAALEALLKPYEDARGIAGEQPRAINIIAHPMSTRPVQP